MKKMIFALVYLLVVACSHPVENPVEKPYLSPSAVQMLSSFPADKAYNQQVAFYVDLQLPSTQFRFFVLDRQSGKILEKGMVLNGLEEDGKVVYSNTINSNCSSHGLAKVSYRYSGRFGKSYKLVGLEQSNSNMFARAVVLHSWSGVPDAPAEYPLINSQGCPTVSPAFLEKLSTYIDAGGKPILMYIN